MQALLLKLVGAQVYARALGTGGTFDVDVWCRYAMVFHFARIHRWATHGWAIVVAEDPGRRAAG